MRIPRRTAAALLAAAGALAVVLALPAAAGAASTTTVQYSLTGTATVSPSTCIDCLFSDTATGTATCSTCLAGDPAAGSFSLDLPTYTTHPPSPCRIKTISGTLSVAWDSGLTSAADVSGHFKDDKPTLILSGNFPATDPVFPSGPLEIVLNNFPPSPCTAATNTVTGTLDISTS
jgi:hypothetical protein